MKFYRRLQPVTALSFDLDDTLYSNRPNMVNAEKKMLAYFSQHFPQTAQASATKTAQQKCRMFWRQFRIEALTEHPQLVHDVSALRLYSYTLAIRALGFSAQQASKQAQQAFDYFLLQRSDFNLPLSSKKILTELATRYPLIAITNGNVDFEKLKLSDYFQAIYTPGKGVKRKPAKDMFVNACQHLAIKPQQLLHIGDCGNADIDGALQAGCQTAWLNYYDVGKAITVLPHIELSKLDNLLFLL